MVASHEQKVEKCLDREILEVAMLVASQSNGGGHYKEIALHDVATL